MAARWCGKTDWGEARSSPYWVEMCIDRIPRVVVGLFPMAGEAVGVPVRGWGLPLEADLRVAP